MKRNFNKSAPNWIVKTANGRTVFKALTFNGASSYARKFNGTLSMWSSSLGHRANIVNARTGQTVQIL